MLGWERFFSRISEIPFSSPIKIWLKSHPQLQKSRFPQPPGHPILTPPEAPGAPLAPPSESADAPRPLGLLRRPFPGPCLGPRRGATPVVRATADRGKTADFFWENVGKNMENTKFVCWKIWMEKPTAWRKNGGLRKNKGGTSGRNCQVTSENGGCIGFWGGSNLFNHHVTSRFWVPGPCDPASFAKTWAQNASKWNWQTHNRPCRWKSVVFLPTKLHIRVSSDWNPIPSQGVENHQFPIRRTAISWVLSWWISAPI